MNKVEAQAQNIVESSQGLTYPLKIVFLDNASHTSKLVQIKRQIVESSLVTLLSIQQLQDMITNTIKVHYDGLSQSTLMHSKPYTKRLDNLCMLIDY